MFGLSSTAPAVRRSLLSDAPTEVAPRLLGVVLVAGERAGRIVEVEAYGGVDDPGSHARNGLTKRNATMFGPAGHLYVYFTYGMHWCANVATDQEGIGGAVLIRALEPLAGLDGMRAARARARTDRDLCSGPAKLTQALAIDGSRDGTDLCDPASVVRLVDDGWRADDEPTVSTRIGLSAGTDLPWRWYLSGDPNVSRRSARGKVGS
jgi:DNA-3-methyladenine glycosylase